MEHLNIDNILKLKRLKNELELEKAYSIYRRLRWMVKDNPSLLPVKDHLKKLIKNYEDENWSDETKITEAQIAESDLAEKIIEAENEFIAKRKNLIKEKLKEYQLSQKDLAKILGHRPNYMSELMNGLRPFSRDDIVVIHRLFGIDLKYLLPPFIKPEVVQHIKSALKELNNKKTKIRLEDW